ncbi:MAG: hypothetical protein CFE62_001925 [Candidatus Aquirickettsiella gammari]|uniref:Uncharacterized protein n=1 Tax=Candidatus Aquirickettsiella gammari TaxID=2016198 RepID=A0A370CKQ1_9COXI|nr:MAG: hypothetical protein CFE62_001925 [Candidatus Aquirickettsiella gammari]
MKHIFAIDKSGSTGGPNSKYWNKVQEIIKKTSSDDDNTLYILWSSLKIGSFTEIKNIPGQYGGQGCTNPFVFVDFLSKEIKKENIPSSDLKLTIITDGEIATLGRPSKEDTEQCISKCDKTLKSLEIKFSDLQIYFISTDAENSSMNLSVAVPFTDRAKKFKTYVYDLLEGQELEKAVEKKLKEIGLDCDDNDEIRNGLQGQLALNKTKSIKEQIRLDLNKYLNNPQLFVQESDEIIGQIKDQNPGRDAQAPQLQRLHQEAVSLQKNLLNTILADKRKVSADEDKENFIQLRELLVETNANTYTSKGSKKKEILKRMKDIIKPCNSDDLESLVNESIKNIISLCAKGISVDFRDSNRNNNPKNNRLARAEGTNDSVPLNDLELGDIADSAYECSIMFDKDIPLLFVPKGNATVFSSLENSDAYTNNPLLILDNPNLISRLSEIIDLDIGLETAIKMKLISEDRDTDSELNAYKTSKSKTLFLSPTTRRQLGAFLSLENKPNHNIANRHALSEIFFGNNKLLSLSALWLAVVYFFCKEHRYNSEDENSVKLMNAFKAYLIECLKSSRSRITLSGDAAIQPFSECPLDLAIYYCVISPFIDGCEDGPSNRLRHIITEYHLKLLDLLGYSYDREWTLHQITRYRVFELMMREEKKLNSQLRNWLRCSFQNSMRLEEDGRIVLLNGKSTLNPASLRVRIKSVDKKDLGDQGNNDYLHEFPLPKLANKDEGSNGERLTLELIDATALDETSDEYLKSLSITELFALEKLLDKTKTTAKIIIPNDLILGSIPDPIKKYGYPVENEQLYKSINHKVSPITMRPPMVDASGNYWKLASEKKLGCKPEQQLSVYNFYQNYVRDKRDYPSKDNLIRYIADKQARKMGPLKYTLPKNIEYIVEKVISDYSEAMGKSKLSPDRFIEKVDQSSDIAKRFELDNSDLRMLEHILSEMGCELSDKSIVEAKEIFYERSLTLSNEKSKVYEDRETFEEYHFPKVLKKYHTAKEGFQMHKFFGTSASNETVNSPSNGSYSFSK